MATISNLDVNLVANTKKFDARIQKSGKTFGGFAKKVSGFSGAKFAGGVGLMVGAIGGIMSVGAALSRVNDQLGKIDAMAKFSDSVGTTVQDMQALQLQAELTGTSQSTLEKGVQRFTRVLGDARAGNVTAIQSFQQLGLSAADFDGLSLTQQLGIVSDKISEGSTAADRASAAYAVFGRQGQELMTFFDGGSAGIAKAADDIDRFGVGLTRVDAAQVEMANDAFTRLQTLTDGIFQKMAVEAAPIMTAVIELFTDASAEAGGWGGIIETGFDILTTGIGFAIDSWNVLSGAVNFWRGNLVQAFALAARGLEAIQDGLSYITGQDIDFGITGLADELQKEADKFYDKSFQQFNDGIAGKGSQAFRDKISEIKNRADSIADAAEAKLEPKVEPQPIDWGKVLANVGDGFNTFGDKFMEQFDRANAEFENDQNYERPSVAAVSQRSAAAQAIINKQRPQQTSDPAKVMRDAANEQIREMTKQSGTLNKIASWFEKGNATVISLNGAS